METPNNWSGRTTEFIMSRIKTTLEGRKIAPLDTPTYNAIYEVVFEVLFRHQSGGYKP